MSPSASVPQIAWWRRGNFIEIVLLALISWVPFLTNRPGQISADTKAYLYLDPGHLIATAASMWNSDQGFGMVTHQNVGYLFPMGPYFWLAHAASIPAWIAQRFWMGGILFFAGLGALKLARELGLRRSAAWCSAISYMLTPFVVVNISRTSAILMPFAGLGFLILFTIRSARRNDWRSPAAVALVVALVGGVNATSILLVGLGPLIWLLSAVIAKDISLTRMWAVVGRVGLLSSIVSLWWLAGLWVESRFGINILQFTESFHTVSRTSSASEVFRGLGYWYFYGGDHAQSWTQAAVGYMAGHLVPTASFGLPLLGFASALVVRWKYRLYAASMVVVGLVVAVGSYPYDHPSIWGGAWKWFGEHTTAGLALRSSNRVVPILVLGLALLVGAGVDAKWKARSSAPHRRVLLVTAIGIVALSPLVSGAIIPENLSSPETLPSYVTKTADFLNTGSSQSSVLILPGVDFGFYRWGSFNDSVWPGLLRRPVETSQITLQGEPASVNLVRALDQTLQSGTGSPASIAPIARLFSAGSVLLQMDTQYERFLNPVPSSTWKIFSPTPTGLSNRRNFGPQLSDLIPTGHFVTEETLSLPPGFIWPKSLVTFNVSRPRGLVRTEDISHPIIVAGDGEGLVTMASQGLLTTTQPIFYEASLSDGQLAKLLHEGQPELVLTDSNQRRLDTYGELRSSLGYILSVDENTSSFDPAQQALVVFTTPPKGSQTVAVLSGLKSVSSSSYGNPSSNTAENQPWSAFDSNPATAWQVSDYSPADGQWISATATKTRTISSIHFVQSLSGTINRWITEVAISVDGAQPIKRRLGNQSRYPRGETVEIPPTVGRSVKITISDVTGGDKVLPGASAVGFSTIGITGFNNSTQSIATPTSLLRRVGSAGNVLPLTIVLHRTRVLQTPPRTDPQPRISRLVELPVGRSMSLTGNAAFNALANPSTVNLLIGRGSQGNLQSVSSSSNLVGTLAGNPWNAFDGNEKTLWMNSFQTGVGQWVQARLKTPLTVRDFSLKLVNDGRHQFPTSMKVSTENGVRSFFIPQPTHPSPIFDNTITVKISIPALSGRTFRFTVTGSDYRHVLDRVSTGLNLPPFGIAGIDLPGLKVTSDPTTLPATCHPNALVINGARVGLEFVGSVRDALLLNNIAVRTCSGEMIRLAAGSNLIQSSPGAMTGIDLNTLVLASQTKSTSFAQSTNQVAKWTSRSSITARVTPSAKRTELVVGQSYGRGWSATFNGAPLGSPTLIDGASMGWAIPAHSAMGIFSVHWTPQDTMTWTEYISAFGLLLLLALLVPRRTRRVADNWVRHRAGARRDWTLSRMSSAVGVAVLSGVVVVWWLCPILLIFVVLWKFVSVVGRILASSSLMFALLAALATIHATWLPTPRDLRWPTTIPLGNTCAYVAFCIWFMVIVGTSGNESRDV